MNLIPRSTDGHLMLQVSNAGLCGMCEQRECCCGETDLSSVDSNSNAEEDMRRYAAEVDNTLQQIAQAGYFGFSEQAVRRAVSIVGPSNAEAIAQWLIQSGERPNAEIASRILSQYESL